jgi:hypothetical protein
MPWISLRVLQRKGSWESIISSRVFKDHRKGNSGKDRVISFKATRDKVSVGIALLILGMRTYRVKISRFQSWEVPMRPSPKFTLMTRVRLGWAILLWLLIETFLSLVLRPRHNKSLVASIESWADFITNTHTASFPKLTKWLHPFPQVSLLGSRWTIHLPRLFSSRAQLADNRSWALLRSKSMPWRHREQDPSLVPKTPPPNF